MQPWRNERGVVLPLALMALLVLGTLSAALLTVGSSEVQIAANHREEVRAQFLAEAGLERGFAALLASPALQANATSSLATLSTFSTVPLGGGNYTVQYQLAGANTFLVVSTGTTTIGSAQKILRATMTTQFVLDDAILSGPGRKDIRTEARVEGICGNIHSNDELRVTSKATVTGRATASEKFEKSKDATIGGIYGKGFPKKKIPAIDPAAFLAEAKLKLPANEIYEMNPDGRILRGGVEIAKMKNGEEHPTLGWKFETPTAEYRWVHHDDKSYLAGTYYVEGNTRIAQSPGTDDNPWSVTLIATGKIDVVSGSAPTLKPHLPGTLFVAGGDITLRGGGGTFAVKAPGLIAAHGKIDSTAGALKLLGAMIEEGANVENLQKPAPPVGYLTEFGGTITYNCGFSLPGPPGWLQILAWGP